MRPPCYLNQELKTLNSGPWALDFCRKEDLWPHVREFADRVIEHAIATMTRLQESGEPAALHVIHGHYADAGGVVVQGFDWNLKPAEERGASHAARGTRALRRRR